MWFRTPTVGKTMSMSGCSSCETGGRITFACRLVSLTYLSLRSPGDGFRRFESAQVQAPVVAGHEVPLGELKLARLEQLEAKLAADRVRWRVVHVREGVHEAVLVV